MGVYELERELRPELPGLSKLTMKYDAKTGSQIFTATVAGKQIPVSVAGNATPRETVAAIRDGVRGLGATDV